jgi:hypothetical protein
MKLSADCPSAPLVGDPLTFDDGERVQWSVTEQEGMWVPGARGDRCLIFMSESVCRRVWAFPPDWRTLSAIALTTLSWQR